MQSAINSYLGAFWNRVTTREIYQSTKGHRNAQRGNGATEIVSSGLESISPAALIPGKLGQFIISSYLIVRPDTRIAEKFIHLLQALIAAAQISLAITILFNKTDCKTNSSDLCTSLFLLQLLYRGTLLTGWLPCEVTKSHPGLSGSQQQTGQQSQSSQQNVQAPPSQQSLSV